MALAICSDWIFQIYFSVISAARGGAVAKDVAAVFLIVVTQFVVKIINCNVLVAKDITAQVLYAVFSGL